MADEARNVEILKAAYTRWSDSKGESVDEWLKICADDIDFGSLAQGAAPCASEPNSMSSAQIFSQSSTLSPLVSLQRVYAAFRISTLRASSDMLASRWRKSI